CLQGYSSPSSV
nr:immunoglobulin light chain junction region [Macaca mulatta]